MNDLVLKYNLLDNFSQKELNDFLDFLISRKEKSSVMTLNEYKKKILNVSIWNEDDVKIFEHNNQLFQQWSPQQL
jgi:hypothetical protein